MATPVELGAGVAIAFLLVDRAIAMAKMMRSRANGQGNRPASIAVERAGEKPPEFWQAEQRKAVTDVIVQLVMPILAQQQTTLAQQTAILARLETNENESKGQMIRLITLIEERLVR